MQAWISDDAAPRDEFESVDNYMNSLENWFVDVRGRGVQWSPADTARAQSWFVLGIPLGTVLRVLQTRARAYRFAHGDDAPLPLHLSWYEPALLDQARHLLRHGLGGGMAAETQEPADSLTELVDALPDLIAQASHVGTARAFEKAFSLLDAELRGEDDEHTPQEPEIATEQAAVDARLEKCRKSMTRIVLSSLAAEELAELEAGVQAQLRPFRGQMGKKALAMRQTALMARMLAERYGLRYPTRSGWLVPGQEG